MNTLADAAFLSSGDRAAQPFPQGAYGEDELIQMSMMQAQQGQHPGPLHPGVLQQMHAQQIQQQQQHQQHQQHQQQQQQQQQMGRSIVPAAQMPGTGRHLQILDHTVHRIDSHTKNNGEEEKEMVVSNLRHFTLKIGVFDPRLGPGHDTELPLKAELLYENGQLVEQLATGEPLLVGKTEVVAMQGAALFKLRITSLSSHRDKQRFRIRVSPSDMHLLLHEPGLSVVTTPMKCVTKLSHRTSGGGNTKANGDGEGEGEEWDGDDATANASSNGKRKRDDIEPLLEAQSQQLSQLQQTNTDILEQLRALKELLSARTQTENKPPID